MGLVLRGGTLIDGTGRGPLAGADIVIDGERIEAIVEAPGADPALYPDSETIDCRGKFVLPGLIDSHVHLAFCAGPDHPATVRQVLEDSDETLALRQLRQAQECLLAGITTVRDCGTRGLGILAVRDAVASRMLVGPRILASGMPITITFGHLYFCGLEADGVDQVRVAARELAKEGVDFFKVMATGGNMTGNAKPLLPQYTQPELDALCEEAQRLDKRVAAHVHSAEGIRRCVQAGVNTLEHCGWRAPDGSVAYDPEVVDTMVTKGIFVGQTVAGLVRNVLGSDQEMSEPQRSELIEGLHADWKPARDMKSAGAKIMVSSDAGVRNTPFRDIHLSLQLYSLLMDVSALETLSAVTRIPAEALGLQDELGTVAVGKRADLLVLNANPLEDLGNVRAVHTVILDGIPLVHEGRLIV